MPRPSLTPELRKEILAWHVARQEFRRRNLIKTKAQELGITTRSLRRWASQISRTQAAP